MRIVCTLTGEGTPIHVKEDSQGKLTFLADADIDADGAPTCYHPKNIGLDHINNAKNIDGEFVGVLTKNGIPLIQKEGDPAPGYYISSTAYEHRDQPRSTQRRYLNSETVPFIVVSPLVRKGVKGIVLGCRARATNIRNGRTVDCLVGDIGPKKKAGEVSIATAKALGINPNPRTGGEDRLIIQYEIWPGEIATVNGIKYNLIPMQG